MKNIKLMIAGIVIALTGLYFPDYIGSMLPETNYAWWVIPTFVLIGTSGGITIVIGVCMFGVSLIKRLK